MRRKLGIWLLLFVTALGFSSCQQKEDDGVDFSSAFERQNIDSNWVKASPGNWGALEYRRYFLPVPKAWLEQTTPRQAPVWEVSGVDIAKLNQFIAELPFNEEESKLWRETCKLEPTKDGTLIKPSAEFRWALQPMNRTALYLWLAQFPQNNELVFPFCYDGQLFQEWLKGDDITIEVRQNIQKLSYRAGETVCFADLDLLEGQLKSREERAALMAVLYRHPYCDIRLHIDKKTDLDALASYWGDWNRVGQVKRKLKEALGNQESADIALPNILPPMTRSLLDTFPEIPKDSNQPQRDCYWTAFNFFNKKPDDRFNDSSFMEKALVAYHDKVEGTPRYGDILFLVDGSGRPFHSAVYLADDFIYTKNGGHFTQPWVIMKLKDLKACYPQAVRLREAYYRWNPQKTRPSTT